MVGRGESRDHRKQKWRKQKRRGRDTKGDTKMEGERDGLHALTTDETREEAAATGVGGAFCVLLRVARSYREEGRRE